MNRKIASLLVLTVLLLSTYSMVSSKAVVVLSDPAEWYMTVPGVLDTDTYKNYPFSKTRLNLGFSKFGELINPYPVGAGVGLEYADTTDPRDPFANDGIPINQWLNGWLINITYVSSILTPPLRNVWAFAMFSDTTEPGVGKDWQTVSTFTPGVGGRQTNGFAETDPITVIQNGPRRFVGVVCTHLYDRIGTSKFPLVDIDFTIIFDKSEKEVLVLKDIHYRLGPKEGPIDVQFSNRGQWDLGPPPGFFSEAKYFHQVMKTCYGEEWLLTPWILRAYRETIVYMPAGAAVPPDVRPLTAADGLTIQLKCPQVTGKPAVRGTVILTKNGVLQVPGVDYLESPETPDEGNTYNGKDITAIRLLTTPNEKDRFELEYKNIVKILKTWDSTTKRWVNTGEGHEYDIAQLISDDSPKPKFVGYAAFWPTCSDYTVDGWLFKFKNLWGIPATFSNDVVTIPPKKIPFLIGEWDFILDPVTWTQWRGVTKYGIVDYHNADNSKTITDGADNIIDKEILYQLNEVFNPWSLVDAVHKDTSRFVQVFKDDSTLAGTAPNKYYSLTYTPIALDTFVPPAVPPADTVWNWEKYCSFAPRVELGNVVIKPYGLHASKAPYYTITAKELRVFIYNPTTTLYESTEVTTAQEFVKILYSQDAYPPVAETVTGSYEWNIVGKGAASVDSAGAAMISEYFDSKKKIWVVQSGLDAQDTVNGLKVPYIFDPLASGTYKDSLGRAHVRDDWCTKVPIETSNIIAVGGPLVNLGAYYLNDFTPAFWDYANSQIVALTCWSQQAYRTGYTGPFLLNTRTGTWVAALGTKAADVGYAVISTFKDKNQTVWLDVWGITGQDTYYASWAIWNTWLGYKLQEEPKCVTSLIVKFDYAKHPYDSCFVSVVECLGTISEYNWGKQVNTFAGDGAAKKFTLSYHGIDTSRCDVYVDGVLQTSGVSKNEFGYITFTAAPATGATIRVEFYLKQPPIHPCRPVPP